MHILEILKLASPAERREIGEIFLSFADGADRPHMNAEIDLVLARFCDPKDSDLAARVQAGGSRVRALSDGLRADGMGHEQLIEAELARRGDGRTVEEYCQAVCGIERPQSDLALGF